ncbi:MAG: family 20 glycosylhydrolase, partial [Phycisphaerae bacterium]
MKIPISLAWSDAETPEELRSPLETLAEFFPLHKGRAAKGSLNVSFERIPGLAVEVTCRGAGARIRYGAVNLALRGVSTLLAGLVREGTVYREEAAFTTFGIMLDCSRNAVMTVAHLKLWFRQLALLGYNQAMLYLEDTYEIPGEPYFGYQRGRYTAFELRELDAYAAALGIELVGCIQTLAHLDQILRWQPYQSVRDFGNTLLVGEEETYTLVGKMLDAISGNLATRRIHIGMDEAHDLGRGAFLDRFGLKPRFEIFNQHLQRVMQQCAERGLKPMIWSDMYFRIGSPRHDYYDPACEIPAEVVAEIPKTVQLVYW